MLNVCLSKYRGATVFFPRILGVSTASITPKIGGAK